MSEPLPRNTTKRKLPDRIDRFAPLSHAHRWHAVTLEAGTTLENIMEPEFWAHVQRKMQVNDRLEILSEDGTIDADMRVVSSQGFAVILRPLRVWVRDAESMVLPRVVEPAPDLDRALPRVEWGGPNHKHRVIGLSGDVVSHGHATKELARQEMARLFPRAA